MEKLFIEETSRTPQVTFDEGVLVIKGRSTPDSSLEFYRPVMNAIQEYILAPKELTTIKIDFSYFNTSTTKCLLDIFQKLERFYKAGNKVEAKWYYEQDDEEMYEYGQDYEAIINLPFEFIQKESQ